MSIVNCTMVYIVRMCVYVCTCTCTCMYVCVCVQRISIPGDSFEDLVFSLNHHNFLLKKGPKTYQLQTAG